MWWGSYATFISRGLARRENVTIQFNLTIWSFPMTIPEYIYVRYSRLSYFQKLDFSTLPISLVILVWFHWTCSVRFHLQVYVLTDWYGRPQITTLSTLTISWNAASRAPVTNLSTVGFLFRGPEWFWATCIVCGPVSSWIFSSLANLISCMTSHIRFWNKYTMKI